MGRAWSATSSRTSWMVRWTSTTRPAEFAAGSSSRSNGPVVAICGQPARNVTVRCHPVQRLEPCRRN